MYVSHLNKRIELNERHHIFFSFFSFYSLHSLEMIRYLFVSEYDLTDFERRFGFDFTKKTKILFLTYSKVCIRCLYNILIKKFTLFSADVSEKYKKKRIYLAHHFIHICFFHSLSVFSSIDAVALCSPLFVTTATITRKDTRQKRMNFKK